MQVKYNLGKDKIMKSKKILVLALTVVLLTGCNTSNTNNENIIHYDNLVEEHHENFDDDDH